MDAISRVRNSLVMNKLLLQFELRAQTAVAV